MAFKKGQSGNPGGRSRKVAKAQKEASHYCLDAIKLLAKFMKDESLDEKLRRDCANDILNRGIGRPAQVFVQLEENSERAQAILFETDGREGPLPFPPCTSESSEVH